MSLMDHIDACLRLSLSSQILGMGWIGTDRKNPEGTQECLATELGLQSNSTVSQQQTMYTAIYVVGIPDAWLCTSCVAKSVPLSPSQEVESGRGRQHCVLGLSCYTVLS
jgi:hypothetical protein